MDFTQLFGRIENSKEVDRILSMSSAPYIGPVSKAIYGSGKGQKSNNHKIVKEMLGEFPILTQETSDCTAFGLGGALNALKCIRKFQGKHSSFGGMCSTEDIYAGSRVQIGRGQLGRGGGSMGVWCAEYVKKYGTLVRQKYGNIDLSVYSGQRADDWGNRGVPTELFPYAEQHQVKEYSMVRTWEELRDALFNGFPISVASNRGFSSTRDKDGFLQGRANWPHQMYFIDVDDSGSRPGALLVNSWGKNWVNGPKKDDAPDGSGWVDAEIIERDMLSQEDSFAYSDYEDFPPQDLDWNVFKRAQDKLKDYR